MVTTLQTPRSLMARWLLPALLGGSIACSTVHVVPLVGSEPQRAPSSVEVVARTTAVRNPLPVGGASVAYGDLEVALERATNRASIAWGEARKAKHPEGAQLFVELTQAVADFKEGRLIVSLVARVTLRTRIGGAHIAQTQLGCSESGLVAPEHGAPVVNACIQRLGDDLAGWLAAID